MNLNDFDYELPEALIAQYPLPNRTDARLMVVDVSSGAIHHRAFTDFSDYLEPGDLMVMNNTRVLPARLWGQKDTGGRVEVLVERVLSERELLAQLRVSKSPKVGQGIVVAGGGVLEVLDRSGHFYKLRLQAEEPLLPWLNRVGHMPLPPYMQRDDAPEDRERYQSVIAKHPGAVAAPTASLHFDEAMLSRCQAMGVARTEVTLHVGAGTFSPVRAEKLEDHVMHAEWLRVTSDVCDAVQRCQVGGHRVVAIGTTAVRSLETAAQSGVLQAFEGDTRLFIKPGDTLRVVDVLLSNFHLPRSTLLMLVCAVGGYDLMMRAYAAAVAERYRFFSYGDAMLIVT